MKNIAIICTNYISYSVARCVLNFSNVKYLMISTTNQLQSLRIDLYVCLEVELSKERFDYIPVLECLEKQGAKNIDQTFRRIHEIEKFCFYLKNVSNSLYWRMRDKSEPNSRNYYYRLLSKYKSYQNIISKIENNLDVTFEDYYNSGLELPNLIKKRLNKINGF
jgi:hypothetical protein